MVSSTAFAALFLGRNRHEFVTCPAQTPQSHLRFRKDEENGVCHTLNKKFISTFQAAAGSLRPENPRGVRHRNRFLRELPALIAIAAKMESLQREGQFFERLYERIVDQRKRGGARGPALFRAREGDEQQLGRLLTLYRNYLTILATTQLDAAAAAISPSDLVQEAMLGAYRNFPSFGASRSANCWPGCGRY